MILVTVLAVLGFAGILAVVAYLGYQRILRRAKSIERGLKMVPIRIFLPPADNQVAEGDPRELMRRKIAQAETLYSLLAGSAQKGFKSHFYGQRHVSFEIVATDGTIHFYAAVPVGLVPVMQQALVSAYPAAQLEEVEDYNPFSEQGKILGTVGGELILKDASSYPLQTYNELEADPLEALLNTLSSLKPDEGAAVQVMIRPADKGWVAAANKLVRQKRKNPGASTNMQINAKDLAKAVVKTGADANKPEQPQTLTGIEEAGLAAIEEKGKHAGFETLIRLVVSTATRERSQAILTQMATAFALLEAPGRNGLKLITATNIEGLVTAFIFRFFPPELKIMILNTVELATIYHLPDAQSTATSQVERQQFHEVDGPVNLPKAGLLFGYNSFRGVQKEVRLDPVDRQRHTYIVGQTGTGKSTMLENLAVQDMLNGDGFAFVDPHGDTAEKLLSMVPKHRAEDIIYFNPGDTTRPLGLNLFEFSDPSEKDFLVQEAINMLYKIYDPGKAGIIGPRFEQWFRNAALTLMSDPAGSTFIEIPLVFTDSNYLKQKFKYVTDQTVIDFWTKEMAQTSDYHKSEMLGWFASKFGAFLQNEMMRDIIGQTKSAFNFREIMDNKKILIVNLSKGKLGELNANLLGMIFIIKFQAAAMSRANMPEDQRNDFCLYVDEFQNFSTDSFATILSEARKYHLNLTVANQFIGQLSEEVKNAVFGNVGTIVSYRTGPEDADFLVKQFAPVFDAHDLVNIPTGRAVLRLLVGGLPSQPFSINALPPLKTHNVEMAEAVKQLSAAKFGTTKAQVEAEIAARMSAQPTMPPARPAPMPAEQPAPAPDAAAATNQTTTAAVSEPTDDTLSIKPQTPPLVAPTQAPVEPPPPVASVEPQPVAPVSEAPSLPQEAPVMPPMPKPQPVVPAPPAPTQPAANSDQTDKLSSDVVAPSPPSKPEPQPSKIEHTQRARIQSSESSASEPMRQHHKDRQPDAHRHNNQRHHTEKVDDKPRHELAQRAPEKAQQVPTHQPVAQAQPRPLVANIPEPEPVVVPASSEPTLTTKPEPAPTAQIASTTPSLQPGEAHVDEHGNVTIG